MNRTIPESELFINADGSVCHLHIRPDQLAHKIILVGDPGRVPTVASHFDHIECEVQNREFRTITGAYRGKRISVVSTGIGGDNIDIVMNELDALANIDFATRQPRETAQSLELVRIGTCGGLQPEVSLGSHICSVKSIGLDGVIYFYAKHRQVRETGLEEALLRHLAWDATLNPVRPYAVDADAGLAARIAGTDMVQGITMSANGFYGPQGRLLRLERTNPELNARIESFAYKGLHVTNYEMEGAALAGMARMLGHKAVTCCMVLANRLEKTANFQYLDGMENLITKVLDRI